MQVLSKQLEMLRKQSKMYLLFGHNRYLNISAETGEAYIIPSSLSPFSELQMLCKSAE